MHRPYEKNACGLQLHAAVRRMRSPCTRGWCHCSQGHAMSLTSPLASNFKSSLVLMSRCWRWGRSGLQFGSRWSLGTAVVVASSVSRSVDATTDSLTQRSAAMNWLHVACCTAPYGSRQSGLSCGCCADAAMQTSPRRSAAEL